MDEDWEQARRWVQFGGTLCVLSDDGATAVVALCRCDGGEQVGSVRLRGAAREWLPDHPDPGRPDSG